MGATPYFPNSVGRIDPGKKYNSNPSILYRDAIMTIIPIFKYKLRFWIGSYEEKGVALLST